MTDLNKLSEAELQAVIENAEKALKERQSSKRKEVIAQIKESLMNQARSTSLLL